MYLTGALCPTTALNSTRGKGYRTDSDSRCLRCDWSRAHDAANMCKAAQTCSCSFLVPQIQNTGSVRKAGSQPVPCPKLDTSLTNRRKLCRSWTLGTRDDGADLGCPLGSSVPHSKSPDFGSDTTASAEHAHLVVSLPHLSPDY